MEYDLLTTFLANPNRVLSRDQLLLRTRNREWEPFDRSIDIRIGRLRRKIEPDPVRRAALHQDRAQRRLHVRARAGGRRGGARPGLKAAPASGESRRAESVPGDSAASAHTPMMQRLEREDWRRFPACA